MAGELPRALLADDYEAAKAIWDCYTRSFDECYVELQIIEFEAQREANRRLIRFAQEVGAPMVVTCDSHYLDPEHADTHDLLMCIRQGKTILDKMDEKADVWNFDVRNLYYRNTQTMWETFANGFVDKDGQRHEPFLDDVFTEEIFWEAVANTRNIAIQTESITLDTSIKLPRLYDDGIEMLRKKINWGFEKRGLNQKPNVQEYRDRVRREFEVIKKLGWADYFLIMERIIADTIAKYGEWAVGYGRGCFHPASRVVMGNGMSKFIGDVRVGDIVVPHDGSKQKVLKTFEYDVDEDLVEVETLDGRVFRCTPEHGIFIRTKDGIKEIQAKDLKDGDDIVEV